MKRILVVRLAGIGDVATASTIVVRIRAEWPDAHVTWLCGTGARPLVELFGVDEVLTVNEHTLLRGAVGRRALALLRLWLVLLGKRFDVALVAHADRRYRLLLASMRVRRVRMLTRMKHGSMNPIPGRFFGDEYARLLDDARPYGPAVRTYDVIDLRERIDGVVARPPIPGPTDVLLVPGGARNVLRDDPLRRWPVERYAEVARRLIARGMGIVIIGDVGDAWVRPAFAGVPVRDAIGELNLVQTLRLMREARLVISHDTGPIHLARLVRTPLLALFGPTTPQQVLGRPTGVEVLWGGDTLACRPCFDGRDFATCRDNRCMKDISVETVVARAEHVMHQGYQLAHRPRFAE